MLDVVHAFLDGFCGVPQAGSLCACIQEEKDIRDQLSEKQIDHMIEDSFPASDPPSTY